MDQIKRLEDWFVGRCDGDWEHGTGFSLGNLDNPGWVLRINLNEYGVDRDDRNSMIERTEEDWIAVQIKSGILSIYCGPRNLNEAFEKFFEMLEV